ncbi:aliphatic sulfonate ABC transporter substrate-binding protein [Mumia sp. zg.B53]|uniref:aliphatic sulfonate ABC transporter substrate-binding protein n=1 Tax=unclassified Mumia TaxID=2621872 RepID=UPI001C6E4C1F|nr:MULTISPECIES: aliphatic sulfonate ABC transporter substrate-binding protein [unclassified Mumia]MBW9204310.1 aliphatic sulfonate ABC transporter substrate-binding protein [Mumia sp. zg.B17]MBW9209705.1 aliphatic sulfonate ABC transporter substrate-binding protein [Mumia sp. zg.B21]MBW9214309.1 aliphatic sulfonate ABC transporter substrate-binding protein [Mumia sp. zg.B53]MDD9350481.1 aliphatic sulfonate ABC transporter substrate-binding protein [Mumia sp.]
MRRTTATLTAAVALLMSSWLSACGGGDDADADEPLQVGYQRFGGLSLVKARNAARGAEWSLFESGPALTEALKAGAVDIGQTGEAPPIFAAAGKTDFTIIATSAPVPKGEAVLVKEKSGFTSFEDLKGKTVALNKGSNVHWLLVKLLEAHDMTIDDIDVKYLKPAEARPAFDNDQVDAWIIWDPYFALAEQPGVKVLADATGLANNREYVLVSPEALEEKPEQIEEFLRTYREVTDWGIANPEERADLLAPELKIPRETAARALARSAQPLAALTPEIGAEIQTIADGFADLDLIPGPVDVAGRVDDRYSEILE